MKIDAMPIWNHDTKTVSFELSDIQYYALKAVDFKSQWHVLRLCDVGKVVE